jgi:hypothetical protein
MSFVAKRTMKAKYSAKRQNEQKKKKSKKEKKRKEKEILKRSLKYIRKLLNL